MTQKQFRGHVFERPSLHLLRPKTRSRAEYSEIDYLKLEIVLVALEASLLLGGLDVRLAGEKDVLELQVSMDDLIAVAELNGGEKLKHHLFRLVLGDSLALFPI